MAKPSEIQVVLVRCGRTDWDDGGRLQGRTDLPLSEAGRQAVEAGVSDLAQELNGTFLAAVHSGPDEASVETAKLIAEQTGTKVKVARALQGMDLGVWDGLLESQLMDRFPTAYKEWRDRPDSVNPPEGESFDELSHRLRLAVSKVLEKANGKPVALVLRPFSFGLVNCWLRGRPNSELWAFLDDGPQTVHLRIDRELIRTTLEELKAKA